MMDPSTAWDVDYVTKIMQFPVRFVEGAKRRVKNGDEWHDGPDALLVRIERA